MATACSVLLVDLSPASTRSFAWLESVLPHLRSETASLASAVALVQSRRWDLIFIDISCDATEVTWFLIDLLLIKLRDRDPMPALQVRRTVSQRSPVHLPDSVDRYQLLDVVLSLTSEQLVLQRFTEHL